MSKQVRTLLAVAVAAAMLPSGRAAAAADASAISEEALAASALVEEERTLLDRIDSGDAATRERLDIVDAAGVESLTRLRAMGVELTPAIETALGGLADPNDPSDVSLTPQAVVYEAAVDDLRRIAATPVAAIARDDGGTSLALFSVAAFSLVALGAAAFANALWRRSEDDDHDEEARNDAVTGLVARRGLDHDIADGARPTAVIVVDVDAFDSIVERHGQEDADEVLRDVATVLGAYVRNEDVVYRYDAGSFCVLLRDADDVDADTVADRIVRAARRVTLPDGSNVTVSLGVAHADGRDVVEALDDADRAVDRARRSGRDCAIRAEARDVAGV